MLLDYSILLQWVSNGFFFQVPNLYENFVSSRDSDSEPTGASSKEVSSSPSTASPTKPERPKVGHTCYVFGYR